jgi:virulence protein VirJ
MLYVYGRRTGDPVVVSSGDVGWIQLAPHIARLLADRGFFVIGLDVNRHLSAAAGERPKDYRHIAQFACWVTGKKPLLVGVSEGAGLSILAATDPDTKSELRGVVALGMPDLNDVASRWREAVVRLAHRPLNGRALSPASVIDHVAPLPLAAVHCSQNEYVPAAEVARILEQAHTPTRLWIVRAGTQLMSRSFWRIDERLLEAVAWVTAQSTAI